MLLKELQPPPDPSPNSFSQMRHLALSPEDGRDAAVGTELRPWISEFGLNRARLFVASQYLTALSHSGVIRPLSDQDIAFLEDLSLNFSLKDEDRVKVIEEKTHHDVTAVIRFLDEKLSDSPLTDVREFIHYGLTSDDINNLAWRIALREIRNRVLEPALIYQLTDLTDIAQKHKEIPMLGRSHGQPAVPTTFGKEMINFAVWLSEEFEKLHEFQFRGKLNGAVGTFEALSKSYPEVDWPDFSEKFIAGLGLVPELFSTQVNSNLDVVEYLQIIQRLNSIIHKLDGDLWRYISDDWVVQKAEGDPSSTMPHKINPIDFEHSEGQTEKANGMIDVLVRQLSDTRLQRDLSDTPLFRDLPLIMFRTLDAWKRASRGLSKISANPNKMQAELNKNWAILASPLQLLLRKAGVPLTKAYDWVKVETQGKLFKDYQWRELIEMAILEFEIDGSDEATVIRELSPDTYLGLAPELTDIGIKLVRDRIKELSA